MSTPSTRSPSDRRVEAWEGLCRLGWGRLGPLRLRLPAILDASTSAAVSPENTSAEPELVEGRPEHPGFRRLTLSGTEGEWTVDFPIPAPEVRGGSEYVFETPGSAFLIRGAPSPELRARWSTAAPALIVLTNARALWADGEAFVTAVAGIREAAGPGPLLWLPRVALPHRLAFLAYIGGDILDTTEARWRGANGEFLDAEFGSLGPVPTPFVESCACSGCASDRSLSSHAAQAAQREMVRVRAAAGAGRLRDLVESRLPSDPRLAELLRYADDLMGPLLEEASPVASARSTTYAIAESHRRPEVRRFRDRFRERYRPPPSKRVLLLVPCSATKPYRLSPSHRRFMRALEGLSPLERLHVASVTSPLGIVPRELEDVLPARHYDIPVTGDWGESERAAVRLAIGHLLVTGAYERAILHLGTDEYDFLKHTWPERPATQWTVVGDRPGAPESLGALRAAVADALAPLDPVAGGPLSVVREELKAVAAFQFGLDSATRLFEGGVRLAGRPWFQRLTDGHHLDLATLREERGLFQLTVAGGQRLFAGHPLAVAVDPAVELEGDIFSPGVVRADPAIRAGDAVLVTSGGRLAGVGEAAVPGRWMTGLPHGLAVRVRHRVHFTDPESAEGQLTRRDSSRTGPVV